MRTPDLLASRAGSTEYWEVKYRSRAVTDPLTGVSEFWMDYASFVDYVDFARSSGCKVSIALYEGRSATVVGRWLRLSIHELFDSGRKGFRRGDGGDQLAAWIWPASAMNLVPAPDVADADVHLPILPEEGTTDPVPISDLVLLERALRRRPMNLGETAPELSEDAETAVLAENRVASLDVLRRTLGVPALPRYSVLLMASSAVNVEEFLGLLQYGIRLFLISGPEHAALLEDSEVRAFSDARLLECSVIDEAPPEAVWVVDGAMPEELPLDFDRCIAAAEVTGGLNWLQYRIVHAPIDEDILVTAGAGTGKTEAMAERLVFLLSTNSLLHSIGTESAPVDLRVDDVVLVTFTREAAREIRIRLARTFLLRQRLATRCTLPALAWLMQLGNAQISTLHSFAQGVVRQGGGAIGIAPGFSLSSETILFRQIIRDALSPHIQRLYRDWPAERVPPEHAWEKHVESIWNVLQNNGVTVRDLDNGSPNNEGYIEWGEASATDGLSAEIPGLIRDVVMEVSRRFADECKIRQSLSVGQLVSTAVEVLEAAPKSAIRSPRFLFIDEFQDTDTLQMDLMLGVGRKLGARLFVVGDVKQGIYRFRGAQGDAFDELRSRVGATEMRILSEYELTRNFRAAPRLLDSLHRFFAQWGRDKFLNYCEEDRLRANPLVEGIGFPARYIRVARNQEAEEAAAQIVSWRKDFPTSSLAVLCRDNWQAVAVQKAIRERGGSCELVVGGSFFQSKAVREMRVFLEAIRSPDDTAALLELCQTRWIERITHGEAPVGLPSQFLDAWRDPIPAFLSYADRLASLGEDGFFDLTDLESLRQRIRSLAAMLDRSSTLSWLVECVRVFEPEGCAVPGELDGERKHYALCLDHLITTMDQAFTESPATLNRVVEWLKLQIATNNAEDVPVDFEDLVGRTLASTVHKAKGLEFDRVIVPFTSTHFGPSRNTVTSAAILRESGAAPRLIWRWRYDRSEFTNVPLAERNLWDLNDWETVREETRLLYVAMTRAKSELVLVRPPARPGPIPRNPQTWSDLLDMGDDQA